MQVPNDLVMKLMEAQQVNNYIISIIGVLWLLYLLNIKESINNKCHNENNNFILI